MHNRQWIGFAAITALLAAPPTQAQDVLSRAGNALYAAAALANALRPTVRIPLPAVPRGCVLTPAAIVHRLRARSFRIEHIYRKRSAYVVQAVGPSHNDVEMLVDGASATVMGLTVVRWAPTVVHVAPVIGGVFVDDDHPFGVMVPDSRRIDWVSYDASEWDTEGASYIQTDTGYDAYAMAVPSRYVHVDYRTGRLFSIPPRDYGGMRLASSDGRRIVAADDRAEQAEIAAAINADRAQRAEEVAAQTDATNDDLRGAIGQTQEDLSAQQDINAQLRQENADLRNQSDDAGNPQTSGDDIGASSAAPETQTNAPPPPTEPAQASQPEPGVSSPSPETPPAVASQPEQAPPAEPTQAEQAPAQPSQPEHTAAPSDQATPAEPTQAEQAPAEPSQPEQTPAASDQPAPAEPTQAEQAPTEPSQPEQAPSQPDPVPAQSDQQGQATDQPQQQEQTAPQPEQQEQAPASDNSSSDPSSGSNSGDGNQPNR